MFHIHKWSKWVRVEYEVFHTKRSTWNSALYQERVCTKCGKTQNGLL